MTLFFAGVIGALIAFTIDQIFIIPAQVRGARLRLLHEIKTKFEWRVNEWRKQATRPDSDADLLRQVYINQEVAHTVDLIEIKQLIARYSKRVFGTLVSRSNGGF